VGIVALQNAKAGGVQGISAVAAANEESHVEKSWSSFVECE
jgi:hypothetical protein